MLSTKEKSAFWLLGWIVWIALMLATEYLPYWFSFTDKIWSQSGTDFRTGISLTGMIIPLYLVGWLFLQFGLM